MRIGELFILGFFGKAIPAWLKEFAARHGLGGVILFDHSCRTKNTTTTSIHRTGAAALRRNLPPAVAPDGVHRPGGRAVAAAEGEQGVSAAAEREGIQPSHDKRKTQDVAASFAEMRALGIAYDFAPVIDVDYNKDNPNIGKIKRSYSADIGEVEANALLASEIAREMGIGLCLKHFPGIGGASVDSHQAFMDISDSLRAEQEELFYSLAPKMFGGAVLVSHAIVAQWDRDNPMTLSAAGVGRLRARLPDTLLVSDDMQMQGLQQALGTGQASLRSLQAGIDMLCIGNNLFDQEQEMAGLAQHLEQRLRDGTLAASATEASIARVQKRKALLAA